MLKYQLARNSILDCGLQKTTMVAARRIIQERVDALSKAGTSGCRDGKGVKHYDRFQR